ncbi:MAG: amidohydrolase family protein [Thermofilaceae archaeon]
MLGKVGPPLRTREDVEFLWQAIERGEIGTIASDHVCLTKSLKGDKLWSALPGFGGSSLLYPIMISEGYHRRQLSLVRIAELVALNPSEYHGLFPKKGTIAIGTDADLTIVDIEKEATVMPEVLNRESDRQAWMGAVR